MSFTFVSGCSMSRRTYVADALSTADLRAGAAQRRGPVLAYAASAFIENAVWCSQHQNNSQYDGHVRSV